MSSSERLVEVLLIVRARLAYPGTDFVWSSWADGTAALAEIDGLIGQVRSGIIPKGRLDLLFAPTSDLQEISISNGWADDFVKIAADYDEAIAAITRERA